MVDVIERTWSPDEAARAEVLRLYDASCAAGAPRTGADIARELEGLKPRWTQKVISAETAARRKAAKADAKRVTATKADAPTLPLAEEPARPKRARAESARAKAQAEPERMARTASRGVVAARSFFALGLVVSIAANIGHVLIVIRPEEAIVRYGSIGMASLWPVFLAAAVEVVSRVAWPAGWRWWIPGYIGTVLVGVGAFAISYQHHHGLLLAFGESAFTALIGPIVLDVFIVVAGVALLAISKARRAEDEFAPAAA
jgi:hypothetical protein